uniref:Uncharacterized protein n=1 Tax=Anguilla anguilla TaxID=7936 RepID=A0A0E9UFK9_ANGAN
MKNEGGVILRRCVRFFTWVLLFINFSGNSEQSTPKNLCVCVTNLNVSFYHDTVSHLSHW